MMKMPKGMPMKGMTTAAKPKGPKKGPKKAKGC